jgi:hypothetical protein
LNRNEKREREIKNFPDLKRGGQKNYIPDEKNPTTTVDGFRLIGSIPLFVDKICDEEEKKHCFCKSCLADRDEQI